MTSPVTQFDRYYATRVLYLIIMPFTKQKAFTLGLIDKDGNKLKSPGTPEEKEYYSELHQVCFELKKLLLKISSSELRLKIIAMSLQILRRKNIPSMFLDGIVMEQLETRARVLLDENVSLIVEESFIESVIKELHLFEEEGGITNSVTGIEPTSEPIVKKKKELTEDNKESIYVSRKVLNGEDIKSWFKEAGIDAVLDPEKMHITIAYSRDKIDPSTVTPDTGRLNINPEKRTMDSFDGDCLVMKVESPSLKPRWQYYMDAGCSFDYDEYQPHITISYDFGGDMSDFKPFPGTIELGPEVIEPLDLDWASKVEHS